MEICRFAESTIKGDLKDACPKMEGRASYQAQQALTLVNYCHAAMLLREACGSGNRPQNLILSISSSVILSPVRSYSLVVCDDSWAAMARASSSAPPLDR